MATETGRQEVDDSGQPTPDVEGDSTFDVESVVRSIWTAYEYMEMPVRQYVLQILLPSFVIGFGVIFLVVVMGQPLLITGPALLLGLFLPFVALVYPKILQDRRRKQVRERFHLFITHITILSTTNIDRVEVFRTLANEDEYTAIAEEMGHIVALIDTWNQSLEDACRMRAKHVSSPLMQDFLDRLAYTVGAGQPISEFLLNEQDTIIQHYAVRYQSQLDRLNLLKDIYLSVTLSTTFGLVFAIIIPFLVGINPLYPLAGVIVLYLFVQIIFLYAINTTAPKDPVWYYRNEMAMARNVRIRTALIVGIGLSLLLAAYSYGALVGALPGGGLPLPLFVAIPFTPLLIPGTVMRREEQQVKNRDEEFPAFIRALGSVESVKQSSTGTVLRNLRKKDFGSLTDNIDSLYKRLAMRIDSTLAWQYFAAETGSYLIQKFSDMYVVGRRMGGEPRQLGRLIDQNLTEVLKLRQKRTQETGTIIGVIYGITATSVFSFFVGLEVVRVLKDITAKMDIGQAGLGTLLHAQVYDIPQIQFFLFVAILVNAFLSSMMIRVIDRGHSINAMPHFVIQVWLSAIIAIVTRQVVSGLITI